jgi:hypothetical protein
MALIVTAMPGARAKVSDSTHPTMSLGWPAYPWREMAQFEYEYASCWRQVLILEVIRDFRYGTFQVFLDIAGGEQKRLLRFDVLLFPVSGRIAVVAATKPG